MNDADQPERPERLAIDRLVTFTDAVVAIAITLVALPLVDVAGSVRSPEQFFSESGYAVTAAGISFAVIGSFWRDHHHLFLRATDYPPLMLRVTLLWLACIVFLPVATVIEVRSPSGNRSAYALYLGTVLLAMVLYRFEEILLAHAGFLRDGKGRSPSQGELLVDWVPVMLMVLVIVVTLIIAGRVGLWSLVLLAVGRPLQAWLLARARRRASGVDGSAAS
ncbi:TMEM175 family protein [Frondihabitans australicus]|uniref:Putative membrane protein n=1 Tax=Frondihabitans australicus TaxID=386892 RepID=A0A495IDS3_9MICO|nr:TMEM175 family protein [Frondihabitans australicus]RKR73638.1 putative membrane protein [Frondihabitans australicus]